jgi:hypothetical protein
MRLSSLLLSRSPIGSRELNLQLQSLMTPDQANFTSQTLNRLMHPLDRRGTREYMTIFFHFDISGTVIGGCAGGCRSGHLIQGLQCDLGVPFGSPGGVQFKDGCLVDSPLNEGIFRSLGGRTPRPPISGSPIPPIQSNEE